MPLQPQSGIARADLPGRQQVLERYFESEALFWRDIYVKSDVYATIHQRRRDLALGWVDLLNLARHAPVLEVGCGAGETAVALGRRGFTVSAVDCTPAMVDLTAELAARHGMAGAVSAAVGDVHRMDFPAGQFALIMALGVLPWLDSPEGALREMSRVLRPGGYVIVNSDNRWRLNHLLDPTLWLRPRIAALLRRLGLLRRHPGAPFVHMYSRRRFDSMLRAAGFDKVRSVPIGFGPFSILGWRFLPDSLGVRLHRVLQRLAERNAPPWLRATGSQYLVLARKCE